MKWDPINGIIELQIKCSKGTYIRSIARDLGNILNSEGCLLSLTRISACGFNEQNSIKISDIEKYKNKANDLIIPTISALDHISSLVLTNEEEIKFWHTGRGITFQIKNFNEISPFHDEKPIKVIDQKKSLLGIGFLDKERTHVNPKLVLNAK